MAHAPAAGRHGAERWPRPNTTTDPQPAAAETVISGPIHFGAVKLIPRALVIGVVVPPLSTKPGEALITRDKLNHLWAEVTSSYSYQQLHVDPAGAGAQFIGTQPEDGVTIQPPLLQVRQIVETTVDRAAQKAQDIFKMIDRFVGPAQYFNLGIKHVYHAPAPGNDAVRFVMTQLLSKTEHDLEQLKGGGDIWTGVKYVISYPDKVHTLLVEPLQVDPSFVFIDLDAQFPGPASIDSIEKQAADCENFLTRAVGPYLDTA